MIDAVFIGGAYDGQMFQLSELTDRIMRPAVRPVSMYYPETDVAVDSGSLHVDVYRLQTSGGFPSLDDSGRVRYRLYYHELRQS